MWVFLGFTAGMCVFVVHNHSTAGRHSATNPPEKLKWPTVAGG